MPRWPEWITAEYLRHMTRCLRIGDIVYLPRTILDISVMHPVIDELWKNGVLPNALPGSQRGLASEIPKSFVWQMLRDTYVHYCEINSVKDKGGWHIRRVREPNWVKQVPDILKGDMRALAEIHGLQEDFFVNMWWPLQPCIPFTSVSYLIRERGLTESIAMGIHLFRQHNNKQLGYLHNTAIAKEGGQLILRFHTTRFTHSMDVSSSFNLIAYNNRDQLSYYLRKNGRAASLTHDVMMVAGGDSVKLADPDAFCEEKNFFRLFKRKGWKDSKKRLGLSNTRINSAVQGKGVAGKILDIADKIYVARDLDDYFYSHNLLGVYGQADGYHALKELALSNPLICDYWDSVKVGPDGEVYFADAEKLIKLLSLRTLLFREMYFHPGSRYLEFLVSNVMVKYMLDKKMVKHDDLIEWMTDQDLDHLINKLLGGHFGIDSADFLGAPHVETFHSTEEAYAREADLIRRGIALTFVDIVRGIKTCTDFKVETTSGKIRSLIEAYPSDASKIEQLAVINNPIRLYYITDTRINKQVLEAIHAYRGRELERRKFEQK